MLRPIGAAPIPDWVDIVLPLAGTRDKLTPARVEALVTGWATALTVVLRSAARVPNAYRPAVRGHTLARWRDSLARVAPTTAAFSEEFLRPYNLGALMRMDLDSGHAALARVAAVLAEVLPIDAGGWRLEVVDRPQSTPHGITATLAIVRRVTSEAKASNVTLLAPWAIGELDRASTAFRGHATLLAEIFASAPDKIEGLMPFELFDIDDLLEERRARTAEEFAAHRRRLWRHMLPPVPKASASPKRPRARWALPLQR